MFSPHPVNQVFDYALAAVIPFHSHVGLNHVVTDYVPKASRTAARSGVIACTFVLFAGLMKLNVSGPGITETVKALWREKKEKK